MTCFLIMMQLDCDGSMLCNKNIVNYNSSITPTFEVYTSLHPAIINTKCMSYEVTDKGSIRLILTRLPHTHETLYTMAVVNGKLVYRNWIH